MMSLVQNSSLSLFMNSGFDDRCNSEAVKYRGNEGKWV